MIKLTSLTADNVEILIKEANGTKISENSVEFSVLDLDEKGNYTTNLWRRR